MIDLSALLRRSETLEATAIEPPLSQAVGYVVVVVIGLLIASAMVLVTRMLKKTVGEDNTKTEMFLTANRSVRTGLTASAVISGWLWSTAMLGSSFVGYDYGVAGPYWFAAGCSPMIVFFSLLGISCKIKIPEAHTLLEIVRIRYGTVAHIVWMFLCLVNNMIAVANMLLGASAAITALTGMNITASTFLLPVGVVLYTFVGGIKATFLTDYIHTSIILIIACFFTIKALTMSEIGSVGHLYDLVKTAGSTHPVSGNHDGSYFTMTSKGAMMFAIIHLLSNFGLVIMDTSFFVKAFSASPAAVVPGYIIGGIAYFAIPWALGTLMSFVALGLEGSSSFPTYPRRMTTSEVSSGLVLPYAAIAIAGKGGAAAILLVTFMAVTSTLSAQVIAVSSIISFDVYRTYINKTARDADVIRWSHYGVVLFALVASGFSTALHYGGVNLGWTLYMLGVLTCPGIFPTVFTILWRRQSKAAAIISPLLGMVTGLAVWLGSAHSLYGSITVDTTGSLYACAYGTAASAFSPLPYSLLITWASGGQNFDWADFKKEKLAFNSNASPSSASTLHEPAAGVSGSDEKHVDQHDSEKTTAVYTTDINDPHHPQNQIFLLRWVKVAAFWSAATFLGHWVLWPLPMYASHYVFTKSFFTAWLIVAIIWLWGTLFIAVVYPLVDGRGQISAVIRGWKGRSGSGL